MALTYRAFRILAFIAMSVGFGLVVGSVAFVVLCFPVLPSFVQGYAFVGAWALATAVCALELGATGYWE